MKDGKSVVTGISCGVQGFQVFSVSTLFHFLEQKITLIRSEKVFDDRINSFPKLQRTRANFHGDKHLQFSFISTDIFRAKLIVALLWGLH